MFRCTLFFLKNAINLIIYALRLIHDHILGLIYIIYIIYYIISYISDITKLKKYQCTYTNVKYIAVRLVMFGQGFKVDRLQSEL